jgi:hypothetical protein
MKNRTDTPEDGDECMSSSSSMPGIGMFYWNDPPAEALDAIANVLAGPVAKGVSDECLSSSAAWCAHADVCFGEDAP